MKRIGSELKYLVYWLAASAAILPFLLWWLDRLGHPLLRVTDGTSPAAAYLHFFRHLPEPLPLACLLLPYLMFIGARLLQEPPAQHAPAAAQPEPVHGEADPVHLVADGGREPARAAAARQPTLHLAAMSGNLELLTQLLEEGADFNARDHAMGYTPLHFAAMQGHDTVCEALIRYGANLDAVTGRHETALHLAARAGYADTVAVLLKYRARTDIRNGAGHTALQLAQQGVHVSVITLMERYDSDAWPYLRLASN